MNEVEFAKQYLGYTVKAPRTIASLRDEVLEMRKMEKLACSTGYLSLDEIIKGFIPGHLYTLTGNTNVGKTTICTNFAYNVSEQGRKVLYVSLEPDIQVAVFFACLATGKKFYELDDEDFYTEVNVDILLSDDCSSLSELKKIVKEHGEYYDLIIVDHIGYFVSNSRDYIQAQSNLLKELAMFSKQFKTAIMVVAHPRKTNDPNKRINVDDIAGSASFKQDSTEVLILHRDEIEDGFEKRLSKTGTIYVAKTKVSMPSKKTIVEIEFGDGSPQVNETKYLPNLGF